MIVRLSTGTLLVKFFKKPVVVLDEGVTVRWNSQTNAITTTPFTKEVEVIRTCCLIEILNIKNEWEKIGFGASVQSPRDVYNSRVGKKWALRRAMADAGITSKEDRTYIWRQFANEFGGFR